MFFSKGDIITIPFPFSNQEDSKPRPVLVISNSNVNKTRDIILAQISTTIRNDEFSYPIVDDMLTHSLRGYSEIRCNKIFTAEKDLVSKKISKIKTEEEYKKIIEKVVSFLT